MEKHVKRFLSMDMVNHQQAERKARRVQANREELVERIAQAICEDGTTQPLGRLHLYRSSLSMEPVHGVSDPCVVI
jgi:hypothetical protein